MGNSIFDDDDDGFSLSAGIEGVDSKKSLPAPVKPVTKSAPSRPEISRNTGIPAAGSRVPPVQPRPVTETTRPAPVSPRVPAVPIQKLTAKPPMPAPALPVTRKPLPTTPVNPTSSLPSIPPAVYVQPEEAITENVVPSQPLRVEKEDISYTDKVEDSLHQNYTTPVDYEAERREAEREAERAEERATERRRERAREQERADRIIRERQEREAERLRLEREEERSTPETVAPAKVLSRKEQAAAKREEEKAKREARKTKGKVKGEKPATSFSGERIKVLAIRITVFSVLGILAFSGLKSSVVPPELPTPNNIIATAKYGMGITEFPTERGSAFVVGFSEVYLTIDPLAVEGQREKLKAYAPGNIISSQALTLSGEKKDIAPQKITSGPYISGVASKDNKNAVYTVSAQVNDTRWIYMDIPVQYDLETKSFVISGQPSFVPAPKLANVTPVKPKWENTDPEAIKQFSNDAKLFFAAWGKSDLQVIDVHTTPTADIATKSGLDGIVTLKSVTDIVVESAEDAATPATLADDEIPETIEGLEGSEGKEIRRARAVVTWDYTISPGSSYSQSYDLIIVKAPSEEHWQIASVKGGIPLSSAS